MRSSASGTEAAAALVKALEPMGDVRSRSVFGGYGVFKDDVMFATVAERGPAGPVTSATS